MNAAPAVWLDDAAAGSVDRAPVAKARGFRDPRLRLGGTERAKQRPRSRIVSIDPCVTPVSGRQGGREHRKGREGCGEGDHPDLPPQHE
jgi:hypothetical protein